MNPELERIWAYASIENLQAKMDYFGADQDTEDAITDLATEYGLVTDYTSMVVVRDEVFEAQGIKRRNRDRVATEHTAQQARAAQASAESSRRPAVSRCTTRSDRQPAVADRVVVPQACQ